MLAIPLLQLLGYLPSSPAQCRLLPSPTPGFWEEQPGFMALLLPHWNWLTRAGGTRLAVGNPTETSGQQGENGGIQGGSRTTWTPSYCPWLHHPHPTGDLTRRGKSPGCGEKRWGGQGMRWGEPPRALEPPVLPSSRGLSALGGSVGTRSSRRFVLVHLGAEPLMHS